MLIYYPSPGCRQGTILAPIAAWRRLPGTGSGGTWPLDILVCSAAPLPPRTTHSRADGHATHTGERTGKRTDRADDSAGDTAPSASGADRGAGAYTADIASTAGHGGHGLPRPNVLARGHDPDVTVITARARRRGHSPLWRCRCRSRRVTARAARHGRHGRSRRARREPWGLSPPGARGRADLPGDRAAAGGRGPPIPKGRRAGKENRFDSITFCLETCDERPLPLMSIIIVCVL